jgi:hypothetical protein
MSIARQLIDSILEDTLQDVSIGMKFKLKPEIATKHNIDPNTVFTVSHVASAHISYKSAQSDLPQVLIDADNLSFSVLSDEVEFI